jgi:hypothetical protein
LLPTEVELARACPHERDQLLHVARRQRRVRIHHQRHDHHLRDRHEVADGVVGRLRLGVEVDGDGADAHQQRVAVGGRLGDELVADRGIAAGAVLDDDLLAEHLGELGRDEPRGDIGAAAGGRGHDQPDRPGGVALRVSGEGRGAETDAERARREPA